MDIFSLYEEILESLQISTFWSFDQILEIGSGRELFSTPLSYFLDCDFKKKFFLQVLFKYCPK